MLRSGSFHLRRLIFLHREIDERTKSAKYRDAQHFAGIKKVAGNQTKSKSKFMIIKYHLNIDF